MRRRLRTEREPFSLEFLLPVPARNSRRWLAIAGRLTSGERLFRRPGGVQFPQLGAFSLSREPMILPGRRPHVPMPQLSWRTSRGLGSTLARSGTAPGVRKNLATANGSKTFAQARRRSQMPKRYRGHRDAGRPRRLIDLVTQIPAQLSSWGKESDNVRSGVAGPFAALAAGAAGPATIRDSVAASRHRGRPRPDDDAGARRHRLRGGVGRAGHLRPLRDHRSAARLRDVRPEPHPGARAGLVARCGHPRASCAAVRRRSRCAPSRSRA